MELTGIIKVIGEEEKFDSGFYKKMFVVTTDERFPQDIKLELFKEKVEQIAHAKVGQKVKASFDLRGNEYNGKYYVSLVAWKVEPVGAAQAPAPAPPAPTEPAPVDVDTIAEDDLPF